MTLQELLNLIEQNLTRVGSNRISGPELKEVCRAIVNYFASDPTIEQDLIPDWTALLTFNVDGSGAGKYCKHPDANGKKRIFELKSGSDIGSAPPTDPSISENTKWIEISPSAGSSIKEWQRGAYGSGLVIVAYNHPVQGRGLYWLLEPARPFFSNDIEAETTALKWFRMGGGGSSSIVAATQAQAETAADTTLANRENTAAITARGFRWAFDVVWTWIKTQTQTITAIWTFTGLKISAQAAAAGKKHMLLIKDDGTIEKLDFSEVDTVQKMISKYAKSTLASEYIERWFDSDGNLIMRLRNDRTLEMGGSAAFLVVNAGVVSGDAGIRFLPHTTGAGLAYRIQDTAGVDFQIFRNLPTDKAVVFRQTIEENIIGETLYKKHYYIETTTTNSAQNTVLEFTLADNEHYDIKIERAEATATDGVSITMMGPRCEADCRKVAATNIEGTTALGTKSELPTSAATSAAFNWNLDTVNQKIQFRFVNHSVGKLWSIWVVAEYTKRSTPSV